MEPRGGGVGPTVPGVLGRSDGTSWGYDTPADYYYGSNPAFGNSGDYAYIYYNDGSSSTDLCTSADYDVAGAGGSGISAQLDASSLTASDSADATKWCSAGASFDSTGDLGTPGAANDACR